MKHTNEARASRQAKGLSINYVSIRGVSSIIQVELVLVYDQNHYFGVGPIFKPKPKLANSFHQSLNSKAERSTAELA